MSTVSHNPANFTPANLQQVKDAQRKLHDLLPIMDDAEACGVPCEGYKQIHSGLQQQLQEIEQRFMKGISR